MKKERTTLVLFILLAILGFAPMVQEHLHVPHLKPLAGVTLQVPFPKPTLATCRDGRFQRQLEHYLQRHYGYRPVTVRLYNQYLWDFYGKTFTKYSVKEGKEGWLYEPWFVEDYYHGGTYTQKKDSLSLTKELDREAFRIYQLQQILEQYGVTLFVCQAPGKDLIYPEYLPDDTVTTRPKQVSARDVYQEQFTQLGVNHVNMEQWFLQMKDTVDFLLFPQKGTHWSNLAALYAADSLFRYLEARQGIPMNRLVIGEPTVGLFVKPDYDLEELYNLYRPLKKLPQHYATIDIRPVTGAVKPKMITVGDSYFWNICTQVPMDSLFSAHPYWYYNSTIHFDPEHNNTGEVNLAEELLSANAVMLLYCSTQLYRMSNDFCRQALIALCYDDNEIRDIKAEVVEKIKKNKQWLKQLEERAENRQIPLDTAIVHEADFVVTHNIETFLPAFKDSIPSKRSSEAQRHLPKLLPPAGEANAQKTPSISE